MSEHKFRAWDTPYSRWAYFTLGRLISGDVADIAQRCKDWCRYTGLKDKNGKEIFEGDIVSFIGLSGESKALVEYDDKLGCYRVKNNYIPNHVRLEVIGNIYENPDLLKGEPNE